MFYNIRRTWSFHVVVLQRMAKKCTKIYISRTQPLFCSLNLLFGGVRIATAIMVCLRSLMKSLVIVYMTVYKSTPEKDLSSSLTFENLSRSHLLIHVKHHLSRYGVTSQALSTTDC